MNSFVPPSSPSKEKENILHRILAAKRREVKQQKEAVPLTALWSMAGERMDRPTYSMRSALARSETGIIAEFKRKSPSRGWLFPGALIENVLPVYVGGGASACSVLTDGDFFGGSLRDLCTARKLVNIPLLRKDFIVDEYQLFQARAMGADAILLIAAALSREVCASLARTAHSLHLEVLLEIHNEEELSWLNPDVDMLGVNNRNLHTFRTDTAISFHLAGHILRTFPHENAPLLVSESGISEAHTVRSLKQAGYRGFLIGETFMKSQQPGQALAGFIRELRQ
ncbi:MAG: indole-3-glycerol phosphate synthase TrpC [Tannerellaceae bacterium]|jgi:indole-3-glycerol phosphate synthase|nr:indole-3-glycerol phosphate synthase TrpC [Tannerellaceae bacterium]